MKNVSPVWFTVFLFAFVITLDTAQASPIREPVAVDVSADFIDQHTGSRDARLDISLTGRNSVQEACVTVELPPEIVWPEQSPAWSGDLQQDEKRVLSAPIRIIDDGRFSIAVIVETPGHICRKAFHHLNFIVENGRLEVSSDPFILMDLRHAETDEERRDILAFPAQTTVVMSQGDPAAGGPSGWAATFSGKAEYLDFDGKAHPIRLAHIEIIDNDPDAEYRSLGRTYTDIDGTYSVQASCQTPDMIPDVQVCVYSRLTSGLITGVCPTKTDPDYRLVSENMVDCPGGNITVNLRTGLPVKHQQNDDTAARAFSVLDAMFQAALESFCILLLDGSVEPPPYIETHFPAPSCYNTSESCIQISRDDALDWDIIYHEYYHYFTRRCAKTEFNDGPGGEHDGSSAIRTMGKDKGLRLAWDEGIASFMAVVVQLEGNAGQILGIPHPAIEGVGNARFENLEGSIWDWDMETYGHTDPHSEGYGSEISVGAILFDLWDQGRDKHPDSSANCNDVLGLRLQTIWNLWNSGDWDDIGKFYGYISSLLMNADPNTVPLFSSLFALNRIAPLAISPAHQSRLSRSQIPTFTWVANGDQTPGYENNNFTIGIFKNGLRFDQCIHAEFDLHGTSWTPTRDQWDDIASHATNTTQFYWYVMGWNDKDFRTPVLNPGLGSFTSNMQNFVFRPNIYANGMMGCPDKPATLFFSGFPLEINPDSNEYPFYGRAAGNDYNGSPIYFILDGRFFLSQSMVRVDIHMYSDPYYSTHIRSDRAEAYAWNEWFYDLDCTLTKDTTAGCRPIWFAVKFSDKQGGAGGQFMPEEFAENVDGACSDGTLQSLSCGP